MSFINSRHAFTQTGERAPMAAQGERCHEGGDVGDAVYPAGDQEGDTVYPAGDQEIPGPPASHNHPQRIP